MYVLGETSAKITTVVYPRIKHIAGHFTPHGGNLANKTGPHFFKLVTYLISQILRYVAYFLLCS